MGGKSGTIANANPVYVVNKSAWLTKPVGGATGIESVQPSAVRSQKIIRDGQLLILRDGKTFNAIGVEVK